MVRHFFMKPLLMILACLCLGCVNGPVRYKALGFKKYATYELWEQSPGALKPASVPLGLVMDAAVITADTVGLPLIMIPYTWSHLGPDASGLPAAKDYECYFSRKQYIVDHFITGPCWFIIQYPINTVTMAVLWPVIPYLAKDDYEDMFGRETGVYRDREIEA